MTEERDPPVACSLDAEALAARLAAIGRLGATSLLGRARDGGARVLRFRADGATRRELAEIVAAERACCPVLSLELREGDGEVVLSIAAPPEGAEAADALAAAFGR
jgi:hypothetical protein